VRRTLTQTVEIVTGPQKEKYISAVTNFLSYVYTGYIQGVP
jgi:hypothetical protein